MEKDTKEIVKEIINTSAETAHYLTGIALFFLGIVFVFLWLILSGSSAMLIVFLAILQLVIVPGFVYYVYKICDPGSYIGVDGLTHQNEEGIRSFFIYIWFTIIAFVFLLFCFGYMGFGGGDIPDYFNGKHGIIVRIYSIFTCLEIALMWPVFLLFYVLDKIGNAFHKIFD